MSSMPGASPALPVPVTESGQAGLAAILADPARALLAVDYDGVLAPIVDDPTNSPPLPGAVAALARAAASLGSVAVISGRPAQVLLDYGRFDAEPALASLVVFGHYGLQRWDARTGEISSPPPPVALDAVRRELPDLLAGVGVSDAWIEDKTVALAVHTRRSADPAVALATLTPVVIDCAHRHGLQVEPGRFVLEIRAPGVDKGGTLRAYAEQRAARSVCYIGDDLGDLPAFDAVETLRDNGIPGLTVASGSSEVTEVSLRADLVVEGPPGVMMWLESLADAFTRRVTDAR
jgi:trehalose 6-phosphate phosphatase